MKKNYDLNFNLNKFLRNIKLKKQYLKNLQQKGSLLKKTKETNYKSLTPMYLSNSYLEKQSSKNDYLITYIIDICFSRSNTFLHVIDFSGKLKFFYSSGCFQHSGKSKKSRYLVFKDLYRVLTTKLKFLKGKPLALHLKNVGYNRFWIVKRLKKKFFIKSVKCFDLFPYNGCRKRKVRRKKFKKRKRRNG